MREAPCGGRSRQVAGRGRDRLAAIIACIRRVVNMDCMDRMDRRHGDSYAGYVRECLGLYVAVEFHVKVIFGHVFGLDEGAPMPRPGDDGDALDLDAQVAL